MGGPKKDLSTHLALALLPPPSPRSGRGVGKALPPSRSNDYTRQYILRGQSHHLLGIDVLAYSADLAVLDLEDEAIFVFVVLAVAELAAVGHLDNHRVAVSVNAPDLAREAVGENLGGVAGEVDNPGFALLEAGAIRNRAGNQPTDFVGHVGKCGLDLSLPEYVPRFGHAFLFFFYS